ncbi:MAG: TadE/TadG family type IV pilus assembly protein [Aestuariivirga sp.]
MSARRKNIWSDESGAALLEFTAAVFTFLIVLFGVVEFAYVFFQWNAATKAVQLGARLAAVSNPVSSDLTTLSGVGGSVPGGLMPYFNRVCTSDSDTGATGTCTGGGTYNAASATAMRTIVFGRGKTACAAPTSARDIGMCNIFDRITPRNVIIRYENTGLGYAGRPGGPVPTITVSLTGLTYNFILIGDLAGLNSMQLPSFATTVTGEDLNLAGS